MADVAAELGIPLIFLKGMALDLMGVLQPAGRVIGDIDVLVAADRAEELQSRLIEQGARPSGLRATDQHLAVITHNLGAPIEVHQRIGGICLDAAMGEAELATAGGVTAEICLDRELVVPAPGLPDGCYLPVEELTVAHLLEHGLAYHGQAPAIYPGFQLLADLQDLGYSPASGKTVSRRSLDWISQSVSAAEVETAIGLLARLEAGEQASVITADADSTSTGDQSVATLLRHLLAGAFDPEYRQSLKITNQLKTTRGKMRSNWPTRVWRALWLTPTQIEILYGKPKTRLGYIGWQLWRPFHLVGKTVASAAAWLRIRTRQR